MKHLTWLTPLVLIVTLIACGSRTNRENDPAVPAQAKTLQGNGYGQFTDKSHPNFSRNWQVTEQSAKLNAYRALADQLYYEPLGKHKTVGSQIVSHEAYRVYFDTYLRQARPTDYRTVKDHLSTTLQLKLTPRFYYCMSGDEARARQCIEEDDKLPVTRLGYKTATTKTVNLACGTDDCSDLFAVKGFSRQSNPLDDLLLDAGLYDTEWTANTGLRILLNHLLLNGTFYVW